MSLRFYIGGSGSGKSTSLQEYIIEKSLQKPNQQFIFLVPDQFTMQIQKEMVVRHPNKGIMNIDVLSFGRLYYKILEETGYEPKLLLDDTGKNLIIRKIALEMEEELPVLGRSMKKTGYVHEVKSVISEFMQYNVSPDDVEKIMEFSGKHKALNGKLADMNKLYRGFLDYINKRYITLEETMDILAEQLLKSDFIKGSIVVLDGFTGFTPIQKNVISRLLELCDEVIMSVTVDAKALTMGGDPTGLFLLSRKTMQAMEKLAKDNHIARGEDVCLDDKPAVRLMDAPALAFLEQEIFRGRKHCFADEPMEIHMAKAQSPRDEMRYVCLKIRELLKEKKYAYRDIAIITGDLSRYAPYAEELFPRYEIPLFVDQTRKLILNPFTEYIKSGLRVIAENFSYDAVGHFLKSGLTGIARDEIDRLENYILALRIKGRRKWERMFVRYPKYMQGDLDALEAINRTRETVIEILKPLMELKKQETAEIITDALYEFIVQNKVYEQLENYATGFHEKGDMVREKEYHQIYEYIMKLLEQIRELLSGEIVTMDEYSKILEAGITEITIGVLPQEVDYIVLGDMQRSRLKEIKALFFVGMNDGIIPQSSAAGGIISDMEREFLVGSGYELAPSPREKMYIQKMYLYMTLTKPSQNLYLSYSQMDGEGKSLRPAYLVGMIQGLFPKIRETDISEIPLIDCLCGRKDSEKYLAELLRGYASLQLASSEKEVLQALFQILKDSDEEKTEKLKEAAFYHYEPRRLGKELSRAIYGAVLENSISRLETYAGCAYAHFLKYGLQLEEREDYSFESVDVGNIFHMALEAFGNKLTELGLKWTNFRKSQGEEILESVLQEIVNRYGESVLFRDARTAYQISRIRRILQRAISNIQYQLKKSNYQPKELEVKFKSTVDLADLEKGLDEEDRMLIRGKIDRIDTCEKDNRLYVKIVDYKSKSKKIDVIKLFQGSQLQLVVYLDHAMRMMQEKNPGKEVLPGAMFYYPVIDPLMEKDDISEIEEVSEKDDISEKDEIAEEFAENADEMKIENKDTEKAETSKEDFREEQIDREFEKWMHNQLRMSGMFIDDESVIADLDTSQDPISDVIVMKKNSNGSLSKTSDAVPAEQMNDMIEFAKWKVKELGSEIRLGEKAARPQDLKRCSYCAFAEICNFDQRIRGYELQEGVDMSKEEVLEAMKKVTLI